MRVPSLQAVLLPYLFDDPQGKQFGIEPCECPLFEELPGPDHHIILKKLYQSTIEAILSEEDTASEIKIDKSDESGMLHLEVHGLEYSPFCLFVVLLTERLFSISLISVQIWHIFVQFHGFPSNDECRTRPKLLRIIQFLQTMLMNLS